MELLEETPTIDDYLTLEITARVESVTKYKSVEDFDDSSTKQSNVKNLVAVGLEAVSIDDVYYANYDGEPEDENEVENEVENEETEEVKPEGLNKLKDNPALAKIHKQIKGAIKKQS